MNNNNDTASLCKYVRFCRTILRNCIKLYWNVFKEFHLMNVHIRLNIEYICTYINETMIGLFLKIILDDYIGKILY